MATSKFFLLEKEIVSLFERGTFDTDRTACPNFFSFVRLAPPGPVVCTGEPTAGRVVNFVTWALLFS